MGILDFFRPNVNPSVAAQANASFSAHAANSAEAALKQSTPTTKVATSSGSGVKDFFKAAANGGLAGKNAGGWMGKAGGLSESQKTANVVSAAKGVLPFNYSAVNNPSTAANQSMIKIGGAIHDAPTTIKQATIAAATPKVQSKIQNPTKIIRVEMPKTGDSHNDEVLDEFMANHTNIHTQEWIEKYSGKDLDKSLAELKGKIDKAPSSTKEDLVERARLIAEYNFLESAKNYGIYMDYDLRGGYDKVRDMDKQIDELKGKIQRYESDTSGNGAMSWDVEDRDSKSSRVSEDEYEQARADLQALQQYRASLKLEVDDAKRAQLGEIYGDIAANPEFEDYAKKGAKMAANKRADHAEDKSSLYSFMTQEEAAMYDALLASSGEENAETFYDFYLGEALKARAGKARAEGINENHSTDFGRTVASDLHGLSSGLSRAGRGLWAALPGTSNDVETTVGDYAAGYIRENLGKMNSGMNSEKPLNESNFSQMTFDAANSMGNMLPMILTSMLVPHVGAALGASQAATATAAQVAAGGVMGLGVYGNVRDEMMKAGYNEKAASTYAALNAASEVALEKVLGGFDALGGVMGIQSLENAVSQIGNAYLRYAATMTVKAMGEGTEEYLQDVIDPLFRNIAFNESNGVDILSEEGAYSYLVAAISVFGGPTEVVSTYKNVARCEAAGAYVNAVREANPELYETLINDAINSGDEDISEFAEDLKSGTYKPNNGNLGQLLLMMAETGAKSGRWSDVSQSAKNFITASAQHLTEMKFGEIQSDARAAAQAEWDQLVMTNPDKKVYSPIETELVEKTGWDADTVEEQANIISKVLSGIVPTQADAKTLDWNNQYVRDILEQYSGVTLTDTDDIGDRRLQLVQISQNAAETESYQQALKEANENFLSQRSGEILETPEYGERAEQAGNDAARGLDLAIQPNYLRRRASVTIPANPARSGGSAAASGAGGTIYGMDHDAFIQSYMEQHGVDQSQAEAAWNELAVVNSALNGGEANGEQVRSAPEGRVDGVAPGGSTSEVHERRAGSGESEAVTGDGAEAAESGTAQAEAERVQGKVIAESDYTEEQTAFVESCTKDGFNSVTLVDGDLFNAAGQKLNAKVDRAGNLTIAATDIETMKKVAGHERVHLWLNSLGERRADFVRSTLERVIPQKMLDRLFASYARVYADAYGTLSDQAFIDAVYEEILCDMYGGLDNYGVKASAYTSAASKLIDASTIRSDFLAGRTETVTPQMAQAASVEDTIEDRVRRDMGEDEETAPDLAGLAREEDYDGEYNPGYDEYYSVAETDKEIHDSLPQETQQALAENGLTIQNGVIVSNENAELMRREGYQKPQTWDEQFSVKTEPEWEASYREQGGDPAVAETVKRITDWMIANEAVYNYLPHGEYASSKFGPLRPNMEYIVTFDMDTSCPRTFQYIHIRDMLQQYAKRPLTFNESMNLLNVMKQTNQMIPCTYCYVENKRILKSSQYLNYYAARDGVMSAKDAASAKKLMYSYNAKKGTLGKAAQEVFNQWRNDVARGEAFHPSAEECWENVMQAQISISNWLDGQLGLGAITKDTAQTELQDLVEKKFKITDDAAKREVKNFVDQWVYETNAQIDHRFVLENLGEVNSIDQRYLTVHNAAMQYANSSSSARSVDNYVPYTDQLKNISDEDRAFVMGMGGIRKHSSNDFRMDYVQDYLMFYADLAAGKWTGHTYTKSTDFCKIFGRTGDRINLSIAFDTKDGKVIMNDQEGANWKEAQELRKAYYNNLGTMAMVTDDLQLSYALNTDWIDMIIPFHASGLPKEVWRNMKAWNDYTSKQLEKYLNATDMKAALKARGVKVPSGAKAAAVAELYNKEFGTKFIYNEKGKRQRPHFYPNDTYVKGPDGEMQLVPGHHNNVDTYFQLCEEYGVHPRFYGLNVTDAQGNVIPVTEHPNYLKLIKETARTETEQQPIEFNLDQYDDYLGMSPMEFIQERLTQESEAGGYENMKVDPAGIIKLFQKDYIGKDRPIGYLSESAARKIKGMSKTMAYKEIEANALGLKPADVDKLHQTPEAQMLHQRMEEMGLTERNSVASETEETEDPRVSTIRELLEQENTPNDIFLKTGLTLMWNGNIIDPKTGQVIGGVGVDAAKRSERVSDWGENWRVSKTGVSSDDGRGVPAALGTPVGKDRGWQDFSDDERDQLTTVIADFGANNPTDLFDALADDYPSDADFAEHIYQSYQKGNAIFDDELEAFIANPDRLYNRLDQMVSQFSTEQTDARTDNGDGRFALDEDVEQEPVISPEVAAQEIEQTDELYSVRSEDPPKKTLIGYKVFAVDKKHPGELYPTKVDNPGGQGTPVGVWLNADTGEIARNKDGSIKTNKNGRIAVKADGGSLAWRPGWHLGSLPEANQMNRVDPNNPESNMANRDSTGLMWDNYVFCECEFAADEDYQLEAFQMGFSDKGTYKHTEAGLPYLPKDGYYKYRTNPNPNTAPWFISGAIKITKILDDNMRREIIDQWNKEHPDEPMRLTPRYSGKDIDLSEYGFTAGPVTPTENLGEIAPGVDYSDEIKDLPGYKPNHINWDNENFQNAFKINGIEDRREELRQKYESNPERYSVFSDQVDEVKNNTHNPQQAVRMGQTPRPLSDVLWLPKLPMLITPSHVYSMAVSEAQARAENRFKPRTNYHDLGWDVVKQIPEQLAHPVMIIKSNTDPNNADVLVLTDLVDKQGRPIAVAIHPDGRGKQLGLSLPENAVLSGYGRNNVQNYLARAKTENRILYANKNNHQRGSRGVRYSNASAHNSQGVQYSDAIMSGDYSDNLAQYQQIVKDKFKGTIFENSVGLSYSVANDPDNHFQPGSLESDMYDLLKADGPEGVEQVINKQLSQAQANRERQATKPLIPPADKAIPVGKAERTYQRNQLDEMIKKYGKIPQGEKAARDIALPKKTDGDHFVRKFVRTVEEAPNTSQRTVENVERAVVTKSDIANYARISDTKANSAADKYYATYGYGKMLKEWNGLVDSNKRVTKWDIAKGERLLIEADAQGDNQAVMRLVGDLAAMGTEAGQVVQAMRLLKKMGPIGQLYYFQKAVDRMNSRYQNRIVNGRMAPIIINQEFAERVLTASTQKEIDKAMEDLIKDTAKQLPVSLADKWNAWRYLSMLGNPRTHIRNVLGNALFRPLITTKDLLAAAGETIFLKDRSQRTKSASYLLSGGKYSAKYRDVVNFATSDFKVMRSEIDGTGKMNTANKLLAAREIYKGPLKFLNTLAEGNSNLLEWEDGVFLQKAYVNALSEYMIARGLTAEDVATDSKELNQARQYAVLEAQKATYRDYCGLANALNSLRNRDSLASQVLVDGIMPFTKTPTNILRRGIEYSPIGLIKGITYDLAKVKQGDYTAAEAIDHIAAGMTGTMVAVLGAFLASMGIARGADDDDKKKAELERAQGHQEYSLEFGGRSFTVDWVAPVSLPFFTGVEAYKRISNGGPLDFYDMADLVTLIAEPMLSLSMLDGLNQTLTAASYGDNNALQSVLTQVGTSYLSQGLPTLGAQIARTLDPYRRANYVDKNSKAPGWMQNFVQQSMGKIPGVADEKMAYVDMWGRKQSTGGLGMRALENFIFPFYMKNINENPVEHELLRLANATGDNSVLPSSISKSFSVDGQTRNLTGDQYETLKTTTGRESLRLLGELMLTPAYSALDDAEKAKIIKNAMTITAAVGRQSVEPDYAPAAWVQRAIDNDNFEDAVIFHTMQSMESGLTNYQLIECMYWLNPDDQGKLISAQYTPQVNMTDYTKKKYKFILDDDMKARSREIYEEIFWVEYPKLYSSQAWANADIAGRADLVKKLQTDVGKAARSAYGDELRAQGVASVYLDDPMEEAEEIAAMINELGYEP